MSRRVVSTRRPQGGPESVARARLSRLGRVTALALRPCGDWIALEATVALGGRVECVLGVGPDLDAVLDVVAPIPAVAA